MDVRLYAAFFLGLAAMAAGALTARIALDDVDGSKTLAAAVAVASLIQAISAVVMLLGLRHARHQASAANLTLELAKDTSVRQLRAYLDLIESGIHETVEGKHVEIVARFRNSGQTPARNVRIRAIWALGDRAKFDNTPCPAPQESDPATNTAAGEDVYIPVHIPWETWALYRKAAAFAVIGIVGMVTYTDVFGIARRTTFRRELHPELDAWRLFASSGGNEAD